jgi:hypothetical protein
MTISSVYEKSKGVLIFANNTPTVDYIAIARKAAKLAEHFLGLPVKIATNAVNSVDNKRYSIDSGTFEIWNNYGRSLAYDITPFDQTILIDCDYLVFNDNLLKVLDTVTDYLMVKDNKFVDSPAPIQMGPYSIPYNWATVLVFNKTKKSQILFDLVRRIETNYPYYRKLYNIRETNYRNDYAFTIADNIINGYTPNQANRLPWTITTVGTPITSLKLQQEQLLLKTNNSAYVLPKQDLHIISKNFLLSSQCDQLINEAINA